MVNLSPLPGTLSPLGVSAGRRRGVQSEFCLGFPGAGSCYVEAPNFGAKVNGLGALSVSLWFKQRILGTDDGLVYANSTVTLNSNVRIYTYPDGALWIEFGTGTAAYCYVSNYAQYVTAGLWTHLAIVFDGSLTGNANRLKCYINGRQVSISAFGGTVGTTLGSWNSSDDLMFGSYGNGSLPLDGAMDDLRFYSTPLSASEIQSIHRNSSPPPTTGLIIYFPFEEGTGTTTTDTIGGLVGTLTGGPTWQPQTPPRLIAGRITEEWSVEFDGSNDYISLASPVTHTDETISLWFKTNTPAADTVLLSNTGSGDHYLSKTNATTITVGTTSPSLSAAFAVPTIVSGVWHHLAIVKSANTYRAYLNGVESSTGLLTKGSVFSFNQIGVYFLGSNWWNGNLKDVRIYLSALPAASIATLARGKEPSETPVARWRLNDGSGTNATDSIGSNHGTLTNGPTWSGDLPQHFRQVIESSQALSCDGVDDWVSVPSASAWDFSGPFTMSAWIKPDGTQGTILGRWAFPNGGWLLFIPVGLLRFDYGNNLIAVSGSVISSGEWQHVLVKRDSANAVSLYRNGVVIGTGQLNGPLNNQSGVGFAIGRDSVSSASGNFADCIDEACIYSRDLTDAEVTDQIAGFIVPAGLVSRYKLDGSAVDSVGTNHGTEEGGVGYSTDTPGTL